jgi:hypothetical protein
VGAPASDVDDGARGSPPELRDGCDDRGIDGYHAASQLHLIGDCRVSDVQVVIDDQDGTARGSGWRPAEYTEHVHGLRAAR